MFAVCVLKEGSALKRRRLYKNPKIVEVPVPHALSFYKIETAKYRNKINFRSISDCAGSFRGRMILPEGVLCPEGIREVKSDRFEKLLLFNTAVHLLKSTGMNDFSLTLCDEKGVCAEFISHLVPLCRRIRIKTQNRLAFALPVQKVMEEYGMAVSFCEDEKNEAVINLDGGNAQGKIVFSSSFGFSGKDVPLPMCFCESSEKIDSVKLASALYDFSHLYSLSSSKYETYNYNQKNMSREGCAELIKTLRIGSAIDI